VERFDEVLGGGFGLALGRQPPQIDHILYEGKKSYSAKENFSLVLSRNASQEKGHGGKSGDLVAQLGGRAEIRSGDSSSGLD